MTFAANLKKLREAAGLTQEQLALRCGWSGQSRIANYESTAPSARQPKADELQLLASALGCSVGELFGEPAPLPAQTLAMFRGSRATGEDAGSTQRARVSEAVPAYVPIRETPPGYVRFQLMDGAGGMGQGVVNQDYPEVIRHVEVAEWEVRRKIGYLPEPGRIALITGRGPSMRPQIDHGDVVMVDTSVRSFDGDGVYVINLGGETQIKMLQVRGDGLYVVSANPAYPPYRVEHAEDLHIGGRVVAVLGIREL